MRLILGSTCDECARNQVVDAQLRHHEMSHALIGADVKDAREDLEGVDPEAPVEPPASFLTVDLSQCVEGPVVHRSVFLNL